MQILDFLLLLWLLFKPSISHVVDNDCVYKYGKDKIGFEKFDNTTQICCNGGIHEKTQEKIEVKCCGEKTFRPTLEVCCDQKVYLKDSIKEYGMCKEGMDIAVADKCTYIKSTNDIHGAIFHKTTQLCCINSVYDKTKHGIEVECCGESTFRPMEEFCCNDKVYRKDSETKCCRCKKNTFWGFDENSCKEKVYSSQTHVCFGHVIEKRVIRHFSRLLMRTLRYSIPRNTNIHIDRAYFQRP